MDQVHQGREYINSCPVSPESVSISGPPTPATVHGPSPGPSGLQTTSNSSASPSSSSQSSRILSCNANGTIAMTSQPSNESELQLYRVLQRANLLSYYDTFICQGGDDVQQLCEAGEEEFLEIMALVGMASKPLHVRRLQKALQEWVNNPAMFQTPLHPSTPRSSHSPYTVSPGPPPTTRPGPLGLSRPSPVPMHRSSPIPVLSNNSNSQSSPSPGAKDGCSPQPNSVSLNSTNYQQNVGEYPQPLGSPSSLTPVLVESQIQRLAEAADLLVKTLPSFDPKPQNNKKKICKDLEYVMNMPPDDPRRMDEIRKYAAIYGRFDCKRKPEKPLTLHEVSVNEAAAQICKHIPALLTRRDELFPLARQVVRDSGYQYSKGHSRSQCYSKTFDDEPCNKRLRFDGSPGAVPDQNQMEEERKRRQDRLEAVTEQIKLLAGQQHDLKAGLQQSQDNHNTAAVGQIQVQLDHLASQHYQLVNEQSELSRQLRRLDRYFSETRYGTRTSCSENEKADTDDTDSQFSVYSYESSASFNHEVNDSPSHETSQSSQVNEGYGSKNSQGKKTNAQITKQLVQETLMDEGLRVVKELASQIKDESDNSIPHSKPEGRPRGRPPKLERDYVLTTAGATMPRHCEDSNTASNSSPPMAPMQNGHNLHSASAALDSDNIACRNGVVFNLRSNHGSEGNSLSNSITDNAQNISVMQDDGVCNESESTLKALLTFSQKGIKQEPPSPNNIIKMD